MVNGKVARVVVLPAAAILIAVLATFVVAHHNSDMAEATGTLTVGLDAKVNQADPGTYSSTLPTFDSCVDVNTGVSSGIFYFDMFVLNTTQLQATQSDFTFNSPGMHILQADAKQFFGTGSTVSVSVTGSGVTSDVNGNITSPSGGIGSGAFEVTTYDTGNGHTGSGVLVRFKAQGNHISGGAVVNFSINNNQSGIPARGVVLTDTSAHHPGDTNSNGFFDGPFTNSTIKVAVDRPDGDGDGVSNDCDNCPSNSNSNQADTDSDGIGNACDPDDDNDGINDASDTCPTVYDPTNNPASCADSDGDGIFNGSDNCPTVSNVDQLDTDGDGQGDVCDSDNDNDGVANGTDNCPLIPNASQADWNSNSVGDACEDSDGDGWLDASDNCKGLANPGQANPDGDLYGTSCDNCPNKANNDQADNDSDFIGDACDDGDVDGWVDAVELFVGTKTNQKCASTTTTNDEATDSTPLDNNDDRRINVLDISPYSAAFNSVGPNLPYKKRLDNNMDNRINVLDISPYSASFNTTCTP